MSTQANKIPHADYVSIYLDIEAPDIAAIGSRMQEINGEAYMNGYNWDAFIDRYLAIKHPEMRPDLERDPEAGTYVGLYENNAAGNKKADRLVEILNHLMANPEEIYAFLHEEGDGVEWD